jgi:hypothetical protein
MQASPDASALLIDCMAGGTILGGEGYTGGLTGYLRASGTNSVAKVESCSVSVSKIKGNNEFTHIFAGKNENGTLINNRNKPED